MSKFPSKRAYYSGSLRVNRSKYSYEYLRQNAVELNLHFRTLAEIKLVITLKYSFIDTISAFGGLGGLMVGASLVTSVEILFGLSDVMFCFFHAINFSKWLIIDLENNKQDYLLSWTNETREEFSSGTKLRTAMKRPGWENLPNLCKISGN